MTSEARKLMDFELLKELISIPDGLDRSIKKVKPTREVRALVKIRDNSTCQMCGLKHSYGNPGFGQPGHLAIHHKTPNGSGELDNLVTLCKFCHNAVHALLYSSGKWRYVPMR